VFATSSVAVFDVGVCMSLLRLYDAFGHFLSDVYTIPSGHKECWPEADA